MSHNHGVMVNFPAARLAELVNRHPLLPWAQQSENNSIMQYECSGDERYLKRLVELQAECGDHICVRRTRQQIPLAVVEAAVRARFPKTDIHKELGWEGMRQWAVTLLELEPDAQWNSQYTQLIASYTHHGILLSNADVVHFTSVESAADYAWEEPIRIMQTKFGKFMNEESPYGPPSNAEDIQVVPYAHAIAKVRSSEVAVEAARLCANAAGNHIPFDYWLTNCEEMARIMRNGEVRQVNRRVGLGEDPQPAAEGAKSKGGGGCFVSIWKALFGGGSSSSSSSRAEPSSPGRRADQPRHSPQSQAQTPHPYAPTQTEGAYTSAALPSPQPGGTAAPASPIYLQPGVPPPGGAMGYGQPPQQQPPQYASYPPYPPHQSAFTPQPFSPYASPAPAGAAYAMASHGAMPMVPGGTLPPSQPVA